MKFVKDTDVSLSVLKIVITLFIILAPFAVGNADRALYSYLMLISAGAIFVLRFIKTRKVHLSIHNLTVALLFVPTLVSALWVSNRGAHFVYLSAVLAIIVTFDLMLSYFDESQNENIGRRLMYMFSVGGILCGFINIVYWLTQIVPFGKKEALSSGIGSNHFLAVFMLVCIIFTGSLIKGNTKLRKFFFIIGIMLMLFVFVMAKSAYAWIFAVCLVIMLVAKKNGKLFFPLSLGIIAVFTSVITVMFLTSGESAVFKDAFSYGTFFGRGGGFLSGKELFLNDSAGIIKTPGLLSYLYASSGVIGLVCAVLIIGETVLCFVKLKNAVSAFNVMLTVMLMLLPLAKSLTVLFLWAGLCAYNEKEAGNSLQKTVINSVNMKKIAVASGVICALLTLAACQRIMVIGADKKLADKKYMEAYSIYHAAASMNIFDSQSCMGAAEALLKSGSVKQFYNEATELTQKAEKRDNKNIEAAALRAKIHSECGRYDLSVQEYSSISSRVKVNSKYNLLATEELYKIIEGCEEGSPEALEAYEKMIQIANETQDLDYREKINNISDKALIFTRRKIEVEQ